MKDPRIKFSHRYSKLAHPCFTTVRRLTAEKECYYCGLVGHRLTVEVEGQDMGTAVLCFVTLVNTSALPQEFLDYDTSRGLYKLDGKMDAMVLTFVWDGPAPEGAK